MTESMAAARVLSPPTQIACASRAISDAIASPTAAVESALASSSVSPIALRDGAAALDERQRVRLGGVPRDADARERGQHLARVLEGRVDRRERALAHHVRRVIERLRTIEADAGGERIGDQCEDVTSPAPPGWRWRPPASTACST